MENNVTSRSSQHFSNNRNAEESSNKASISLIESRKTINNLNIDLHQNPSENSNKDIEIEINSTSSLNDKSIDKPEKEMTIIKREPNIKPFQTEKPNNLNTKTNTKYKSLNERDKIKSNQTPKQGLHTDKATNKDNESAIIDEETIKLESYVLNTKLLLTLNLLIGFIMPCIYINESILPDGISKTRTSLQYLASVTLGMWLVLSFVYFACCKNEKMKCHIIMYIIITIISTLFFCGYSTFFTHPYQSIIANVYIYQLIILFISIGDSLLIKHGIKFTKEHYIISEIVKIVISGWWCGLITWCFYVNLMKEKIDIKGYVSLVSGYFMYFTAWTICALSIIKRQKEQFNSCFRAAVYYHYIFFWWIFASMIMTFALLSVALIKWAISIWCHSWADRKISISGTKNKIGEFFIFYIGCGRC